MAIPDSGRIYENPNRPLSGGFLNPEIREQVDITLDYAGRIAKQLGRSPTLEELSEIAQRSLSLIYTGLTPEEKAKATEEHILRTWGINPGHTDRMTIKGKSVRLTKTHYDILKMFAVAPGHLVTYKSLEDRFDWKNPRQSLCVNAKRINRKMEIFGPDAPIELVSIRKIGYRADPKVDNSTPI